MGPRPLTTLSTVLLLLFFLGAGSATARDLRSEPVRYDFSGKHLNGWTATDGVLQTSSGGIRLEVTRPSAALLSPGGLEIDAALLDRVEVSITSEPAGAGAVLYWTDDGARGFVPDWRLEIPDGRTVVRLGENPLWRGEIDRFLLSPGRGARSIRLESFEVRRAEGFGERAGDGWAAFIRTELRSHYSVNGILGAFLGRVPFTSILAVIFVLLPLVFAFTRRGAGARHAVSRLFLAGTLLFFARSAVDEVRIARSDTRYLGGKTLMEKTAAMNPPGFFPLILEAKRRIPEGAPVELRAPEPYPWEKGAFYLYPSRVRQGAGHVISYQRQAPADSATAEILFRREGTGSVYARKRSTP